MKKHSPLRVLSVFVTSCETGPGAWRHEEEIIRKHFPKQDRNLLLATEPETADIILIGNLRSEDDYLRLRTNPMIKAYPEKCFVVSMGDFYSRYVKGIVSNLSRSPFNLGRFESGGFFLIHPDFQNPYIDEFILSPQKTASCGRDIFVSFIGRNCCALREALFNYDFGRPDIHIKDNSHFDNFAHGNRGKCEERREYFDVMRRSKFALCPRGWGPGTSQRLFDAMALGTVPVVMSDTWVYPRGPKWKEFSVRVPERRFSELEKILLEYEEDSEKMGELARKAYADAAGG